MQVETTSISKTAFFVLFVIGFAGCASSPKPHHKEPVVQDKEATQVHDVFVYPSNGQTESQTDRDKYECHIWAVQQSHFDPSLARSNETPQVKVVAAPPGTSTATGAMTGAMIGAVISDPRHAGAGALVGAVSGAIIGSAADAARQEHVEQAQREYDRHYAASQRPAQDYRRAVSACLEGRHYTVN
jgi:Glycine zipper 2TM domain